MTRKQQAIAVAALVTLVILLGEAVLIAAVTSNPEGPIIGGVVGGATAFAAIQITRRQLSGMIRPPDNREEDR